VTRSRVAVIRTQPDRVLDDVTRVMELGGLREAFDPAARTLIKDNISWHYFFPAANTTPWQLEGAIRTLKGAGYDNLAAVHNRTVVTHSGKGERLNRLDPVFEHFNIPRLHNFDPVQVTWEVYKPRARTPALSHVYPDGIRIPSLFKGTNILHLPTVKCHIYTTTTGAMKNAFGGLLNTRRHYTHSYIHRTLVDLLAIQKEIHTGLFALMDGTHAGDGPGPRTMRPVEKNIILASADQVAIDAVSAKLMGFDPLEIDYIKMAQEEGLGTGNPRDIELVGDDVSSENWHFRVGDNAASRVGDLLWFGPLKGLQKMLFHTPMVGIFILGSYLYHDYLWYPLFSGPALKAFRQTGWGRLFDERYGPEGTIHKT